MEPLTRLTETSVCPFGRGHLPSPNGLLFLHDRKRSNKLTTFPKNRFTECLKNWGPKNCRLIANGHWTDATVYGPTWAREDILPRAEIIIKSIFCSIHHHIGDVRFWTQPYRAQHGHGEIFPWAELFVLNATFLTFLRIVIQQPKP